MPKRPLAQYCRAELDRLKGQEVMKTVNVNGQTDSVTVRDLEALFQPLTEADISKPDAYQTDTITDQLRGDSTFIVRSKGKETKPFQLIINVDARGQLKSAQISSHTTNLMYTYRQEVVYERNRQLRISTFQKIVFLRPEQMEVIATFKRT